MLPCTTILTGTSKSQGTISLKDFRALHPLWLVYARLLLPIGPAWLYITWLIWEILLTDWLRTGKLCCLIGTDIVISSPWLVEPVDWLKCTSTAFMVQQWRDLFSAWSRDNELNSLIRSGSNCPFHSLVSSGLKSSSSWQYSGVLLPHLVQEQRVPCTRWLVQNWRALPPDWPKGEQLCCPWFVYWQLLWFSVLLSPLVALLVNTSTVQPAYQGFTPSIRQIEWGQSGYMYTCIGLS